MSSEREVEGFLRKLKGKIQVFDIIYLDQRPKNSQTLADLEITGKERDQHIQNLQIQDYSEGPLPEDFYNGDSEMWVFGKRISEQEVYIKLTLGMPNRQVICISFHIAEHEMNYPFK